MTARNDSAEEFDYDLGWKRWRDMVRFYPSAVHRRRLVASWVAGLAPRSVLDVGCGPGEMLRVLHDAIPAAAFTGVDISEEALRGSSAAERWCRFQTLDIGRQALGEQFDLVVCSEVLEHVRDHEAALTHLCAMTGRHLMITVPTGPIFPLEAGFNHLRHYELTSLCEAVRNRGLEIVRAEAWGYPFMTLFKIASNLKPELVRSTFGSTDWNLPKRAVGKLLTGLFYLNVAKTGPQLLLLASRP